MKIKKVVNAEPQRLEKGRQEGGPLPSIGIR